MARRRFSPKMNERISGIFFCFFTLHGKKQTNSFVRFFGKIYGAQICLRFNLTFRWSKTPHNFANVVCKCPLGLLSLLPGGHNFICGLNGFTKSICRRSHQAFPKFFFDGYQSSLKWSFDKDIGRHSCYWTIHLLRKHWSGWIG